MKKRTILALMLAIVMLFSLAACGPKDSGTPGGEITVGSDMVEYEAAGASEYDPTYTVGLRIIGPDDDILYDGKVALKSPNMWANEFLQAAVSDKGLAQSGIEVGFVETLGDYTNNSTDNIYWTYTVNGGSPAWGSNQLQLRDGDVMVWTYAPWEELPALATPEGDYAFTPGSDVVEYEAAGASEYDPTFTVNLKIVGAEDDVLFDGKVTLKSATMWANEFLQAAVSDKGLAQSGIEVGFVETLGDYTNNSTDNIYWGYTVNGVSPMVGSNQYQLRDNDYMVWTYAEMTF